MSKEHINEVAHKHEQIRQVLIEFGCDEYGDAIVDCICALFDYPQTEVE